MTISALRSGAALFLRNLRLFFIGALGLWRPAADYAKSYREDTPTRCC